MSCWRNFAQGRWFRTFARALHISLISPSRASGVSGHQTANTWNVFTLPMTARVQSIPRRCSRALPRRAPPPATSTLTRASPTRIATHAMTPSGARWTVVGTKIFPTIIRMVMIPLSARSTWRTCAAQSKSPSGSPAALPMTCGWPCTVGDDRCSWPHFCCRAFRVGKFGRLSGWQV